MFKNLLSVFAIAFLIGCGKDDISPSVKIGTQVWMTKNLDVDHYRNGDPIPQVTDPTQWGKVTSGAWCYYNNDPANGAIYGKLYNWYAVNDSRGLAPEGWHVATDVEWTTLSDNLGGEKVAGGKLKESGTAHWKSPNKDATNSSGFSGVPGGGRYDNGAFKNVVGGYGCWWTSSSSGTIEARYRYLRYSSAGIYKNICGLGYGFSVRCVKD